jgi:hypothetical protein
MVQNKIVVRYADGRILKGVTNDFFPNKKSFHVFPSPAAPQEKPKEVHLADLKAIFFVKDFEGNPEYTDKKTFDPGKPAPGRKISVAFKDGEILVGTTTGYQPGRSGFFVTPADSKSNADRFYVITQATREIKFL